MTKTYQCARKTSIDSRQRGLRGGPGSDACRVSLPTVVDLAQRNSTGVRAAQADLLKAGAVLAESKDVVIPSLLFSTGLPVFPEVGFTGSPPSIWSATIQSTVFSVPQKRYIDAARYGLQAATARLKDAREQVALDASTAYIELDTVNRELDAAHQQETLANRLVQIEQERAEAGVDPLSDLLQARLTAAEIKLKRLHLETRAETLAKQLAVLTGLPLGSITPDHASIPEIPQVHADDPPRLQGGIQSAQLLARSKQLVAKGDEEIEFPAPNEFCGAVQPQHQPLERRQQLLRQAATAKQLRFRCFGADSSV